MICLEAEEMPILFGDVRCARSANLFNASL
jgi:hypothetical protein